MHANYFMFLLGLTGAGYANPTSNLMPTFNAAMTTVFCSSGNPYCYCNGTEPAYLEHVGDSCPSGGAFGCCDSAAVVLNTVSLFPPCEVSSRLKSNVTVVAPEES